MDIVHPQFLPHGQIFLRGLAANQIDADVPVQLPGRPQQHIKALAGNKLADGKEHSFFRNAQLFPELLFFLTGNQAGQKVPLPQRGKGIGVHPVPPGAVIAQVIGGSLPGTEIAGGTPNQEPLQP